MLSYARGPNAELLSKTIPQALSDTVSRHPEHPAVVVRHQHARLTWRELGREVERLARGLAGLGLKPGDRVGIWSSNCLEWFLIQLASAQAGLVLVNVNPAYRSHELRYVLEKSGMKALFLREKDARADYRAILDQSVAGAEVTLRHAVYLESDSWDRMMSGGADLSHFNASPDDVVNIQYTSGTTGSPKGVLLTHRNLLNNAFLISQCLRTSESDRLCMPVPMYHCFGCVVASLQCVLTGAMLIMPAPQFDPLATLEAVAAERATILYGVPTMFIAQLDHAEFARFDLTSLRTGIMAGAPCPIEVMRRVVDLMHCREITIAYGQTESSPVITMSRTDDPLDLRVATVGAAMPETEVKIVSTATGETVPAGEQGELCTRGYLVMKGYDAEPQATLKAVDSQGWLHTGDLAVMREDGYFRITGRAKDMLIRGGENIYPREVEEFLYTHPKVSDVQVVGLPDARLGEAVLAWIKLKPGETAAEEEIREFCRGRIAHFKVPQYIRFVDSFPMTVTGKIQKFRIREMEIEQRGLQREARIETA